jgi:UDP-N-acetylmuramate: L-alanyl-gamma-D-glutamyl-meso-diaminopimelate ligase
MHLHILGICGTFMGGIAALARQAGHRVTGADQNVYPPMSEQLERFGIELIRGYDAAQLDLAPDVFVVGNVMSRGNPLVEAMLDAGAPYVSGPEWLARHVLPGRLVLAVAGTHGKTTTSSLLAWILEHAGLDPGFLIGGIPSNFDVSARLGGGTPFVVEADEYDTAFFDKRAKLVHYRPRVAVLNNLEHDHADIYPDVAAIAWQFHQMVRTVPATGRIVSNARDDNLVALLARGCWTPVSTFSSDAAVPADWSLATQPGGDYSTFDVAEGGRPVGTVRWGMPGRHNAENALAAFLAARAVGVDERAIIEAIGRFAGVRRRLEIRGRVGGITVYDDFAHHPTAIAATVDALRRRVGAARVVAVLEPRSNTMKLGTHRAALAGALTAADRIWLFEPPGLGWGVADAVASLGGRVAVARDVDDLVVALTQELGPGDHVLVMSNGSFGGLHGRLLAALRERFAAQRAGA